MTKNGIGQDICGQESSLDFLRRERHLHDIRTRSRNRQKPSRYIARVSNSEPQNALYNVFTAECYLIRGIMTREEMSVPDSPDEVRDRQAFELGIAELRKAVRKPYLHNYRLAILRKELDAMPAPRFTEDYLQRVTLVLSELYPEFAKWRTLARKIPGCARVLLAEGRRTDAEAVMDSWKPLSLLLIQDTTDRTLLQTLVARAVTAMLAKGASDVYVQLGATAKAAEARGTCTRNTGCRFLAADSKRDAGWHAPSSVLA